MNDASPAAGEQRFRDGFFTVPDGLRLHYRDYPGSDARPPLLCLHGLTRNVRSFAGFAERYSPRFRVIALDFRGRGKSDYDPVSARYNPLTYAADVLQLFDELQLDHAIFVGTSLGGLVTMTMAALAPNRIAAAILNDVGPELGQVGLDRILSYVGRGTRFASWEEAAAAIEGNLRVSYPDYGPQDWLAMAHRNCHERDGAIEFDYDMAIAEPFKTVGPTPKIDMWPLFVALAQEPLLVIRGEISELLTAPAAARMHDAAPNAKFVVVPGVGHAPELDEPAAVTAIDEFLASLSIGAGA